MNANVGNFLHRWARREPERIAIVDTGRDGLAVRYGELDSAAARLAAALRLRGLDAGDRVAICTANGMDFVTAWFGAVYAGCTTLPIPASSTAHEIAFRLQHAKCKALLTDDDRHALAQQSQRLAGSVCQVLAVRDLESDGGRAAPPHEVAAESIAMLLYTSGTTGAAKGVCITHGSLGAHTKALVEQAVGLDEDDRVLGTLPLSHSYGIRTTLLAPFFAGARTIFVPRFSPKRTLELCARHRITWLPAVPTMFIAWANETSQATPPSLRWCLSAGAPLVEDIRLRAERRLGAPVRQGYGLTEANLAAINAPPDRARPGSSGKAVAGVELRIAGESGEELGEGERGEVLVRGQNVMAGYLDDAMASAYVMREGWLHTGDIGFLDEDGRLTVVDRSKDLILRGGASIYPSEVEEALGAHPSIAEVAVVGLPDDYYGEEVVAIVVPNTKLEVGAIDSWARERLASYKVPRRYAIVESIPRGASGKTVKRRLRDKLISGEIDTKPLDPDRSTQ